MGVSNSHLIRLIAVLDMAFASLLVCIYMQKMLTPMSYSNPNQEAQTMPSLKLVLLGPIIFNAFQIVMAYNLFTAAGRRCDPLIAYAKANTWFQFSCLMLMLLLIKLFLILWFPAQGSLGRRDIFGSTLIILEAVFKIFGLFIVRELIDDLKEVLNTLPTPQYYCIYTTPQQSAHLLLTPPPTISGISTPPGSVYQTTTSPYPFTNNLRNSVAITPQSPSPNEQSQTEEKRNSTLIKIV